MSKKENNLYWPQRIIPPAIDFAMLAGVLFLIPWLGAQIFAQSSTNHFFLIPGFFLIIAGVIAIRSLPKYSFDDSKDPSYLAVVLVFFMVVIYSLFYAYATNIGGSEQGNDNVALIVFFVFLIPVLVSFAWPTSNAKPGSGKALIAESVGLISVNYLTLLGAATWYHFSSLPIGEDPVYATGIWFLILFAILYLLFLGFFGLPRIYLLRATKDKLGLAAYLIGVAIFLWNKLPPIN